MILVCLRYWWIVSPQPVGRPMPEAAGTMFASVLKPVRWWKRVAAISSRCTAAPDLRHSVWARDVGVFDIAFEVKRCSVTSMTGGSLRHIVNFQRKKSLRVFALQTTLALTAIGPRAVADEKDTIKK
jgi:hypothetical protein